MPHFVYILECADGTFYVGTTADIHLRVDAHNDGRGGTFTRQRLPVRLVFHEIHPSAIAARVREQQLKRWTRAKKAALIAGDSVALKSLSRSAKTKRRIQGR